ncbi:hypothetical protein ACH4FX_02080 [Streptomyces sp. NPDC018019]
MREGYADAVKCAADPSLSGSVEGNTDSLAAYVDRNTDTDWRD